MDHGQGRFAYSGALAFRFAPRLGAGNAQIAARRENRKYLPGIALPDSVEVISDLACALESVNRSFYASTAGNHFATLFAGHYDDGTRRMRYVNCGHCPPLVLRATGEVERLAVTATALGMFEASTCGTREIELRPNDMLAIFSDGVTDATNASGEEFGAARLLAALRAYRQGPASAVVDAVLVSVLDFSPRAQRDDITLIVARGRDRQD